MEHPEQVLWVPTPWSELVSNDELPDKLDDSLAGSEELAKEPGLRGRPAPISSRRAVHKAPGDPTEVWDCIAGAVRHLVVVHN